MNYTTTQINLDPTIIKSLKMAKLIIILIILIIIFYSKTFYNSGLGFFSFYKNNRKKKFENTKLNLENIVLEFQSNRIR